MRRPFLALLLALSPMAVPAAPAKATKSRAPKSQAEPEPQAEPREASEAPSTTGKSKKSPGQAKAHALVSLEGLGRTPEQEKLLGEVSRALKEYEAESRAFHNEVKELVERRYKQKRASLSGSYEKSLIILESQERTNRLDAISRFEGFLRLYPNEPRATPDVMFRLAELYYERSTDEHYLARKDYTERLRTTSDAAAENTPPEPEVDFKPSIGLYRKLLAQFPDYKLNDGSLYLLAYCLSEQQEDEESLATYQQLTTRYPTSRFTIDAWTRIGEYWFEDKTDPAALRKAADAYSAATRDTEHRFYDKARYKLAWTYYRMDWFEESVDSFLLLLDHYQSHQQSGDKKDEGDLRAEALQYIALSLSDENWGGMARAQDVFAKRGGRPYEAEVYRRLGNIYFEKSRNPEAIAAYQQVLATEPLAADAPRIQERIVKAYELNRRMDLYAIASEKLANSYLPGGAWYEKNKNDPNALSNAQALAEKSLFSAAAYQHQQAQTFQKEGKPEQAQAAYVAAARAYGTYLERFPRSKSAYAMRFFYADSLFNSSQFDAAAQSYELVRDSNQDDTYRHVAAHSAVLAWKEQLAWDVKEGRVPERKPLRASERPKDSAHAPVALVATEARLVKASDTYVALLPKEEAAPAIAYLAAELFYTHDDFAQARPRFEAVVRTYPKHAVAGYAVNLIIESFLLDQDWKSVEEVSARLASNAQVVDPNSEQYRELMRFKLAGRFNLADQLTEQKRYEEAAKKYLQLVDEAPQHEFADKALNNAAVSYESLRRFDSAMKLYERVYRDYPKSPWAHTALFRVAINAHKSYDFDKAVTSYQKLVKDYPAAEQREDALFNAAALLEGQQRYAEAAAAFQRCVELFPNSKNAPENQYRATRILEKQGDTKSEIKALEAFVRKFESKPEQAERVVDAKRRMGDAWAKRGNTKEAQRAYAAAADEFDRRRLKPDTQLLAAEAAAYSRFQLAEAMLQQFDSMKFTGAGKALQKSFAKKAESLKSVNEAYAKVLPYKRLEWSLAAFYRRGYALQRFGDTILESPVPLEVKRMGDEAVLNYQDQLTQQTVKLEERAVQEYIATLAEARKYRVSNQWTRRTLESLNRFRPKEYPVLKTAKAAIASDTVYPDGLMGSLMTPVAPASIDLSQAPRVTEEGAR
ncbi:MAG: tetratricopeptide repeat protein [Myxococcaceae bacterium]|nr:MAG: tetratricopeptide repeat protein [Myxococcaceae bacterium]